MTKRIISFILTILLVVSDVPWTAIASGTTKTNVTPEETVITEQEGSDDDDFAQSQEFNDATAKGTTGNCTWALYGTELVISGKGAMANYSEKATLPWGNSITKVTIGAQVTDIGEYAFRDCTKLTSVEIPNSVNSIGFGAFSGCSGLTSITIPFVGNSRKNATDDGQCPFGYIFGTSSYTGSVDVTQYHYGYGPGNSVNLTYRVPKGLQSVTITDGKILPYAFENCSMLTSIKIPDDTTSIGGYAFSGCTNLPSIELGNNLTAIDNGAFMNCKKIKSFVVPEGVTYIGTSAFRGCSGLTNITIPNSVVEIGPAAFEGCYNLAYNKYKNGCYLGNSNNPYLYLIEVDSTNITEFVTHEDTRVVGWYAFSECSSLTSVKITDKVTRICSFAFMNCSKLSNVSMGNEVNRIDGAAFRNCSSLTSINIPNSVSYIGNSAFLGCSSLTSINIPNSVSYIGNSAFLGCSSLKYWKYKNANYLGNETNQLLVLVEVTNKYINTFTFHKDTRFILDYAFENCNKLTDIVIPEHIIYIGDGAFTGCSSLAYMTVPFAGQTKETDDGFKNVFATLFRVNSGDGFYSVTYRNDSSSTECYVPNSLCSVTVTGGEILPGAFYGCKSLTKIILPTGITSIGAKAFCGCEKLTSIVIPDSVTSIGAFAFTQSGITRITVPAGVTRIDAKTFQNSWDLVSVVLSQGVTVIGDCAFYSCISLNQVVIPDSVTVIGKEAFANCDSLTNIIIPNSVVSIGEAAFSCCNELQSITLPFVGKSRKTESDTYQYPFGFIFGGTTSSDGIATTQNYYGSSLSSTTSTTYYIPHELRKVTITGGTILRGAFENCTALTTIVLGEGMSNISERAFSGCTNLKNITLPNSICNIKEYAFLNCTNLENITIPNSIVDIQDYAFSGCSLNYYSDGVGYYLGNSENPYLVLADTVATNMTSFDIRKDTKVILDNAFYSCSSLTSITISEGIKRIGAKTFYGCSKLSKVTIPESVTAIGYAAFSGCSKLTNIYIPKNVKSIGSDAFNGSGLTKVDIPDLEAWCLISFGNAMSNPVSKSKNLYINGKLLTSLVIPATISRIESYAFYNCTSLTSISLPNSVTQIGREAFAGCSSLTTLTIPNSVNTISAGALARCSKLQSLTIPFVGTSRKTPSDTNRYPLGYIFGTTSYTGGTATSQTYYTTTSTTSTYYIPTTLKSVTVTDGNIFSGAFQNCKNLTEINLPDNISELGNSSFSGCSSLKKIYIPKGTTVLGNSVFKNCSSLTDISIPDTVISFGNSAFYNCTGLKNISIPVGVTSIGDYAFQKCTGLTEVIVPDSVESIGANVFNGCSGLQSISIPFVGQSRKTDTDKNQYPFGYIFGSASYTGGTSTKQYYYGSSLSTTTYSTYYIPTKLKKVTITDGDLTYGAFYNCKNLITIVIGDGVQNISKSAFIGTDGLEQFEVSRRNPNYCSVNRILYNKDQTEIIWVPGNHTYIFQVNYIYANGDTAFASISQNKKAGTAYSAAIPEILGYSTRVDSISGTMPADDLVIDVIYYENDRLIYGDCNDSISWTLYNDGILVLRGIGEMPNYENGGSPWAAYADKVQMIYLDARITSIGSYAFENCSNMTFIDYGYSIKTIGEYAFSGCSSLKSFKLPDSVSVISKGAFFECTGLENVVIADYITSVADNAFMGCDELIQVTIGGAVSEIGNNAFADCDKLTQVYFRGKPVTMGNNAFGSTSGKYVYYYSTVAGWDDVITDGLWHGYIAVPYNAIIKENFTGTNIYIIKVVDKHNAPLANAVVNLGGKIQSTNVDGMVYYVKPEEAQKLTVSCSNHITFEDDTFLATNSQLMDIIELSDKPSTVQGIRLNNQSIATSIVVLNCAESKTVTITVSGYSKYTITKYELYQDNRLISTNKTSASNCTFQVVASAFEEGETVLVRMHTADGNMVATALNIDVVKLATIAKDQVIAELSDVNIGASLGDFGDLNFEIPFSIHGVENITVYTEGRSIFVGINLDVIDIFSRKLSKKKIQEAIDNTIDGGVDGWPSKSVEVEICGLLEIEYLGNDQYYIKSSYVKMRVELWLETEMHASFYGIVGVYFKVRFGAAGELELHISRFDPEEGFGLDQLDLTLENMIELEGGVFLLWGVGSAGVFGNLTLGFTVGMVPTTEIKEVYVTGDLGIRWKVAWGLLSGQVSLGPKDIYRWPEESTVFMVRLFAAKQNPNSYAENDRSYLEDRSPWQSGTQDDGYLQINIYDNVAPKVVTCGNTTVMVWLDDNDKRDNANFQMLYYSVYSNGSWSAPMAVCDNGTFDCEFDVYTDGKKIYVIYTEMKDILPATQTLDITDLTSIEDLVVGVEVNVIVYENGKFGTPVRLTNNSICEQLPTITEVDGKITASWLESNALGFEIEIPNSSVVTVVLGDKGWSNPVTLANGLNSISDISTGSLQDNSYTAYIVDADGVGSTTDDQVLVLRLENGDSIQLDAGTISNVTFTNITGIPVLTWYNNGKIYMISDVAQKPVSLVPENVSAGIDYQIVSVSEEQTLLFFTMKNCDQNKKAIDGTDIYVIFIDCNGALSSPVRMTKTEGYVTSYSIYVHNEELFAVFTETFANVYEEGLETVTHFRTATFEFRYDIVIENVKYDISKAHPSSDFNISFRVTNNGTHPVDYITLYFYDHLGTLLYTTDCDIVLLAGESADCEATIVLPQNISTQAYMVEILPRSKMGIVEDSDPANNRVDLMLAYTDMSICAEQKIIGEKNYIIFSVSNEGNMASTAMLKVYAEGRLISELEINAINPGSTEQYLIDIHALTSETDRILTCVVLSEFTDPYTLNNTDSVYLMHIENETFTADPEKTIRNPELSTNVAEFDKYTAKDIILEITAEADSFVSIENLTLNADYIINNDFVTISSAYLATLKEGIHTLNFIFDFGNNSFTVRSLTVTVTDTTPIALTGSVSISGEYVVGGTVSADLSKLTPNTSSILYIWSVDGETVGTDSRYTIRSLDYGKTLTLTVTATDGFAGTFTAETIVTLRKPGAPNTPVISRIESTSFTLVRVEGVEYSLDCIVWQDSNVFDNLQPNQNYTVYARRKATEISLAGDSSTGVTVTTLKATRTAPAAPELQSRSYNTIILVPNESMEYKIEGGAWTDNNIFSGLQPNTTYVFYQRYKETEYTYASNASTASFTTEDSSTITGSLISFAATDENVTIKLMQNGVEMASVVTTGSTYELTFAVPEGVYQLVISKQNHVTRIYELEVTGKNIIQDVKIHLIGDINGDGKANAVDKKLIYNHMNDADKSLVGYAFSVADINNDGKVNAIDKKMIYNHMNDATKNLW